MPTRPRRDSVRLRVTIVAPPSARAATRGLAAWLTGLAPRAARGEVTIALVSDARMRQLNRDFRGIDRATDVLSFPAFATASPNARPAAAAARASGPRQVPPPLGDLAIAAGVAARQAKAAGHALRTELRVLALHGLLHLLGYDHEQDAGRMARIEARLRRAGGLPGGLIERAHGPAARPRVASR